MTVLTQTPSVTGVNLYGNNTTAQEPIGSYAETQDGRGFRYCAVGAVSTVPGKLYQGPAADATNQTPIGGLAITAQAVGDKTVTITSSITLAANLLAGGLLYTDTGSTGQGYVYQIGGNTAVTSAANCVITLNDPIAVALTTSSKVVVTLSPFNGIVITPTTLTSSVVGVPGTIITNANYGWVQTYGPANILSGVATSITPGVPVAPSGATGGSVVVATAVLPTIGWAMQTFTATEYQAVYLLIK